MRFAYIDSQGNEVSIPSVDALALRIELGAIGPDTQLYDAQADRWGPAQTHEIFHTLSRDVGGEGAFVAPPPPVEPPPVPPPPLMEDVAPPARGEAPPSSFDFAMPLAAEGQEAAQERAPGAAGDSLGFDLTLAEPTPPAAAPSAAPSEGPAMDFSLPAAAPEPPKKPAKAAAEEAPVNFDFGGGLELAPSPFAEPEAAPPIPTAPSEPAMDFSSGSGLPGAMDLAPPPSAPTMESPPAWMDHGPATAQPEAGEGAMDVARQPAGEAAAPPRRRAAAEGEEAAEEPRERREPRTRPSPPKRARSQSLMPVILGVVGLAVVGAGGWFGWKAFQGRRAAATQEAATPVLPPVTIPSIPAELLPRMRDLGEVALADMMTHLGALQSEFELAAEPNRDWLAGVYLANASQFPDVKVYWEGIETFVDRVRDTDTRVFHESYQAQLESAGIAADTAAMLLERADSGFLATRADRFEVYAQMDDLVNAALDLHEFLLANEASIDYTPAGGGVSRDPVLEAVPATRELGREMWGRVDRITEALDALGTLDKVTTERLVAVLFDRIRRAGFQ